ncbi:MAG: RNA methyltransferase [Betaproteobacteria bacterium]|nr:MAG: RNA methyltransferase [Betaproteobacteria bacterium]
MVSKSEFESDFSSKRALANTVVVLSHTSHPGNIGAAARAMKTMGLTELRLVNPDVFPSDIATARASGADDLLEAAKTFPSLADAVADCVYVVGSSARGREFLGETMNVRSACATAVQQTAHGKAAIVFGCEMSGMTNAEVLLCQTLAYIPTNDDFSSLNLGAAVQVFAYELRMAAGLTEGYDATSLQPATQAEIENMYAHLETALVACDFYDPQRPRRLFARLRRLFGRTRLEREEVDIFRGICTAIVHHGRLPR